MAVRDGVVTLDREEVGQELPPRMLATFDDDNADPLGSLLDELEGMDNTSLNIYQLPRPGQPKRAFCFSCLTTDYTLGELLTKIQLDFGAGEFEITATQQGHKGFLTRKRIFVAANANLKKPITVENDSGAPVNVIEYVDKALRHQTETMAAVLKELIARDSKPVADPMEQQRSTLDLLMSMREIFAPPVTPAPAATAGSGSMVAQLKELMELKALIQGDREPGESSPLDAFAGLADKLLPLLSAAGQASEPQKHPAPAAPRQLPTHPASPQLPPQSPQNTRAAGQPTPEEKKNMLQIIKQVGALVDAAKMGTRAELYAHIVYEQFDDDQLAQFLNDPGALDKLAIFNKEVTVYRDWFDELKQILLGWLAEDAITPNTDNADNDTINGDTPRPSGDAGDVARDVEISQGGESIT